MSGKEVLRRRLGSIVTIVVVENPHNTHGNGFFAQIEMQRKFRTDRPHDTVNEAEQAALELAREKLEEALQQVNENARIIRILKGQS